MPRKETGPLAIQTCMHGLSICSNYEYQHQIRKIQQTSRNSILSYTAFIWEKNSLDGRWNMQQVWIVI